MKKKNIFLWFLLFIFLTTYNFNLEKDPIDSFFHIKKIEVDGIKNGNIDEIQERLKIFNEENIITIDQKKIITTIADLDFVKDIKIKKIYPNKIKIIIDEYNPIGVFVDGESKYVLAENGKIIKNYKEKFKLLPSIYGENANKSFPLLYKVLQDSNFDINTVDHFKYFESDRWDIFLKNSKLIKLPSDHDRKAESIKKFLSVYKKEKFQRFKVFDFRVKNQLIMK